MEKWKNVYTFLTAGSYPLDYDKSQRQSLRRYASKFQIKDGELFFGTKRRVIKSMEEAMLLFKEYHSSPIGWHSGIRRTREAICSRFYWHGMSVDIQNWVLECDECQKVGKPLIAPQPLECIKHIKSVVETCHRELEQSSERSGERFQRDGMAADPGSPSESDQRGTEEDELDGFPVIAADEEDCDLDSSSSVKGRHSDEQEENDDQRERASPRGADAGENAQHPQMGEVYSQTEVDSFLEDPGGGHETEALYSPLMKIKDEPIDEGYDKALTAPSHPARIKQELENVDPEAMAPPDELKISSVFSVRGDDAISASAAASQPPPFSAVGQSAPAIKVPPMVPPIQAHPHLQPKPLGQPQLLPLPLTQPQLQPLPLPQSLLQAQLQPQPPPASVRICCSGCSKVLQKGQTAFQRKGSNQLFCSTVCLTGFNLPPTLNIAQKKTCHLCLKIIGNPKDLITVPVDASNTLKEFCSQACLNIFKSRGEGFADDATVQCSICRNPNEILHEVTHQGFLHRLCSDDCFSRFRSSKRLSMSCCESCGSCTATGNYHLVQVEDAVQKFCSPICITTFKQKSGKNVHCPYCNEFKAVDQMLEGTNTQGVVEFFCSSRCLTNSQASRTLSGASFPCTNCQKLAVPQYHLAMPDGSIRNFCSYECVGRFQEKLNHPTPTTHMNGGSTAAPFPAPNMASRGPPYPSAGPLPATSLPAPSQVHHPSMSYTCTPSQNPSPSSQPPLVPYGPASGLADPQDNQRQHPDPTAYGTIKLTCKQCQSQFSSKPEVLQFKNHTGLFCSRMCCDTYKREKDVKAVCEYCRHDKVVKDVAVYEHRARPFCCEGCKLFFKHDLAKRREGQCRVCAYCCNMTHSVVQNHFGGKLEEFCTEECMSLYTVLFYEMAKCHSCKTQGILKESLRWDETILYFCNLHCVVQFCSKSVSLDQPHSNGITSATEAQTPLSISKDMPVIGGVVSLASALAGNTALTGALPTSNCSSKIIGDASTQTDAASHAITRHRRTLKNKALMCKPIVEERAVQLTDENGEKVRLVPVPVPIPVPVYIPLPMHLYTQYTPVPVGLPLPLPVPMVAPAFGDAKGTVPFQSSVDDEDVEKGKGRSVSHGDQGSTYSGDLESEARSTPFSWADTEDTTHSLKPLIPSSVMEGAPSMVDLEKDFPLASNDHGATKEQKPAGKRRRRGKREDADDQVEELDTDDGSQPMWDTDSEQLNVETCQRDKNMKNVSSKLKSIPTDDAQIEPHAASKSSRQLTLSSQSNLKLLDKTVGYRTLRTKRNFCVYCKKPNTKIGRHLQQKHATETDVAHALSFPKGSKQRHLLFEQLCKKGNYQHNIEVLKNGNGEIVIKKRTKKNISSMEYLPCQYCLAFYLRHALLKHENSCKAKITPQALQEQTFQFLDTLSPVGSPNPTSSPESRLQPNPVSSQTSAEFFLPSLDLSQSCCQDTEKYSPEISPASQYCYQSSRGTNPARSPQPSELNVESCLPSSASYPDNIHSPSLNLCHQSSFRSSPEPGSRSDFESCFQATERSRQVNSSSPSPKFSYQTSLRTSTEPSPQISQTSSESCLPSTLKSSLELHSPPNPDSSSSPQPTLDSCLQSDMRSSPERSLPSLESCLKSSMKSRPNHFLQSNSESSTKPTNESDHLPSLSCRSSPQSSLTPRPKYSLRSTSSRVSRTNFNTDNSGNHEYELDSDASSGSAYDPVDDESSDCSINSDDSLDRPVAKNLIADVDVNSTFTLSSCQDNSLQSEMGSAREMKKTFGSSTGFSPQSSENSSLIPSSSSGSVIPKQLSVITCNKTVGGQKWNKRQFCVYCKKPNTKIARHLIHKHANETDVAHALSFRKGSKRRLLLLDQLRKKGNYLHNIEVLQNGSGELVTYKRPTVDYSASEYLPCQHCLAFYVRHDLWRHEKACKMRKDSGTGCRRRIQSASSKMLPVHGFRSGACEEIIHGMNQDSVLDHIREDDLICKYGDTLMVKHGQEKKEKRHAYISQKLRELGRFMLAVKEFDQTVQHLDQICTPSRFELAIKSAKKISGFDESSNKVETPSLVLKIGYSLRQTAEILFGESFMGHDSETAAKAKEFIELLETNWISCVRNSDLDIPESNDFDMGLENPSESLTACQQSETDNIESALLSEIGATSQYSEKTPDLPPDLTLSIQPIPELNLEDSQNLTSQLLLCSSPNVNGQNMDNKECELNRSSLNEFHPTKNRSSSTEPSTGLAAARRKKSAKNIRINSKFSTLSCLRAKPRCKASSSKSKFSSVKSRVVQSCKTFGVRRIYGKKQSCLYCKRLVSKIARHLEKKHAKEKDVAHALSFPKGSNTRKLLLKQLRNKGNYEHNIEIIQNGNGEIIPLKRPKKNNSLNDYEPCPHCLGFYVGRVLWQHQRSCKMKKNGENSPRKRRFRLTTFALHESLSEGCQDIVRRMRDDNISKHLRNDSLICKFGNRLYEKVGHQNAQQNYISQKMRELGRFMLAVKELDRSVEYLHQVCSESKFNLALESAKVIGGFDKNSNKFKTPVIVLKLGYSLKRATEIALAENSMGEDAADQARRFIELLETDWITFVSSHTCTSGNSSKQNTVDVVLLTEDVIKLQKFLRVAEDEAKSELIGKPNPDAWKRLRESLLAEITLFNRRRKGVADKMLLENYINRAKESFSGDRADTLTKLERSLSDELIRIGISCGDGSTITVLLTKQMASSLDLLIKCRKDVDVPVDNPFIFARLGASTHIRATDCLRNLAQNCGAGNPEGLTSGYTHKHVAILYQILSLNGYEKQHIAKLVGDDSYDYQGLNENSSQLAKICSLLHTMDQGAIPCGKDHGPREVTTAAEGSGCVARSKEKRKRWGEEEQQAVRKQMGKKYINLRKVPGKKECLDCIKNEPDALKSRTWKDIKNYIHNTIQSNKRRMAAKQMEEDCSESDGEDRAESNGEDRAEGVAAEASVDRLVEDGGCSKRRHLRRGRRRLVTDLVSSVGSSPSSSKLHHMYGVNAWTSWVQWRGQQADASPLTVKEDVLRCSSEELSSALCRFICEVRRPNGQAYAPDSVYYLCLGIQQHLLENGRLENIFVDPLYSQFTADITALLKNWEHTLPPSGLLQSRVEESFLWECKQLGALSPFVLLNTLLFFGVKLLGLKTLVQHRRLSFSNVGRCSRTSKDGRCSHIRFRFTTKEEGGEKQIVFGKRKREQEDNEGYLPENTENPLHCPVRLYEFYLSKCSDSVKRRLDLFYLQPLTSCHPDSPLWFSDQALDPDVLESMLVRVLAVRHSHLEPRAEQRPPASSDEEGS